MRRRNLILAGGAILVFGVALAAQPTGGGADRNAALSNREATWRPGTDIPMSAFEDNQRNFEAPR